MPQKRPTSQRQGTYFRIGSDHEIAVGEGEVPGVSSPGKDRRKPRSAARSPGHAEEALRASEERYGSVVAALAEGIVFMDADGWLRASNASAERILGLTAEQIGGGGAPRPPPPGPPPDGSPRPPRPPP